MYIIHIIGIGTHDGNRLARANWAGNDFGPVTYINILIVYITIYYIYFYNILLSSIIIHRKYIIVVPPSHHTDKDRYTL